MLDVKAGMATLGFRQRFSWWVRELSRIAITGPRRWRSRSRRKTQTSSCPMLLK